MFCLELNEAQKHAVTHYGRPCLVLAGPGSGKTAVLVKRVRYLIEKRHVPPSSILVITYTKAAALSMQRRFIGELGGKVLPVTFGTFHAVFFHILKEHYHLSQDCILTPEEKRFLLFPILQKQNMENDLAEEILACISLHKNGFSPDRLPLPEQIGQEKFLYISREYDRGVVARGKMDFDDMLVRCGKLFSENREVLRRWQKRFGQILVDEFQDCNKVQYDLVRRLSEPYCNLFVAGDDDQAIYGFRGASPGIVRQFEKDFPSAEKILLEANYRSREKIVEASRMVIAENTERFSKNMYAAGEGKRLSDIRAVGILPFEGIEGQFSYLAARLCNLSARIPYSEMAVLFRTNSEIEFLLPFLIKENVPFAVKSQIKSRYAHFTVRDIAAYLQLALGRQERRLWIKVINKPDRNVSRLMLPDETVDLTEVIHICENCGRSAQAAALGVLQRQLSKMKEMSPYLAISMIRHVLGYDRWLKVKAGTNTEIYEKWKEQLDEVQRGAKAFLSIRDWLSFVKNEEENMTIVSNSRNREGVQLMTMHASKGLEFSYVAVPNVNEGVIPYGRMPDVTEEEEERRLFYVGMTRAKTALDILYLTGTKEHPRLPSRFLNPIMKTYSVSSSTSSSNS